MPAGKVGALYRPWARLSAVEPASRTVTRDVVGARHQAKHLLEQHTLVGPHAFPERSGPGRSPPGSTRQRECPGLANEMLTRYRATKTLPSRWNARARFSRERPRTRDDGITGPGGEGHRSDEWQRLPRSKPTEPLIERRGIDHVAERSAGAGASLLPTRFQLPQPIAVAPSSTVVTNQRMNYSQSEPRQNRRHAGRRRLVTRQERRQAQGPRIQLAASCGIN